METGRNELVAKSPNRIPAAHRVHDMDPIVGILVEGLHARDSVGE